LQQHCSQALSQTIASERRDTQQQAAIEAVRLQQAKKANRQEYCGGAINTRIAA
tara:strand:+ start:191 stop:352 length:162 start_codon:yes stop_codon:yes gene_type:complete